MQRGMIYDSGENIWKPSNGLGIGIKEEHLIPENQKMILSFGSEPKYIRFDLLNHCRNFFKKLHAKPNYISGSMKCLTKALGASVEEVYELEKKEQPYHLGEFNLFIRFSDKSDEQFELIYDIEKDNNPYNY